MNGWRGERVVGDRPRRSLPADRGQRQHKSMAAGWPCGNAGFPRFSSREDAARPRTSSRSLEVWKIRLGIARASPAARSAVSGATELGPPSDRRRGPARARVDPELQADGDEVRDSRRSQQPFGFHAAAVSDGSAATSFMSSRRWRAARRRRGGDDDDRRAAPRLAEEPSWERRRSARATLAPRSRAARRWSSLARACPRTGTVTRGHLRGALHDDADCCAGDEAPGSPPSATVLPRRSRCCISDATSCSEPLQREHRGASSLSHRPHERRPTAPTSHRAPMAGDGQPKCTTTSRASSALLGRSVADTRDATQQGAPREVALDVVVQRLCGET